MKFLLDENISKKVSKFLRQLGYLTIRIRKTFPGIPDYQVLELASNKKLVLITADKDFGELVFKLGLPTQGVILLRLKNQTSDNSIKALGKVLDKYSDGVSGNFIVVTESNSNFRIRFRKL